jgi:hypothetical protein
MRVVLLKVGLAVFCVALMVVFLYFALKESEGVPGGGPHPAAFPLEKSIYVWQQQWSSEEAVSVRQAAGTTDAFMVLGTEFVLRDARLQHRIMEVDWPLFAAVGRPVWIVLRVHQLPGFEQAEDLDRSIRRLAHVGREVLQTARKAHATVLGIQLDYDCATEHLGHYDSLLHKFSEELPNEALSITALPAWLRQPEFVSVLGPLDHYVLQVHSIEAPAHADEPVVLCDAARVRGWVREASLLGVPFLVALPTYGYRLFYDTNGNYVGLGAEGKEELYAECTTREVRADPGEIAGLVRALRAEHAPNCRGFAWFRLPVEGDRLNWTWPVLEQVMGGRAPRAQLRTEVRNPSPALYEVWVANRGISRPVEPIRIAVDWRGGVVLAHDAVGGFRCTFVGEEVGELTGMAPSAGEVAMAAWFRLTPKEEGQAAGMHVGEVEIVQ